MTRLYKVVATKDAKKGEKGEWDTCLASDVDMDAAQKIVRDNQSDYVGGIWFEIINKIT